MKKSSRLWLSSVLALFAIGFFGVLMFKHLYLGHAPIGFLQKPVKGEVIVHFGEMKNYEPSPWTFSGIVITAPQNAPIVATQKGKVVYSDELRGFGKVVIINHGKKYLSIYAHCEKLLKTVGEEVGPGTPVAEVGVWQINPNDKPIAGLYFELRHKDRTIDPERWRF